MQRERANVLSENFKTILDARNLIESYIENKFPTSNGLTKYF